MYSTDTLTYQTDQVLPVHPSAQLDIYANASSPEFRDVKLSDSMNESFPTSPPTEQLPCLAIPNRLFNPRLTALSQDSVLSSSSSMTSLLSSQAAGVGDTDFLGNSDFDIDLDDGFFEYSQQEEKGRSKSFGGSTKYSSQLYQARDQLCIPRLATISGSTNNSTILSSEQLQYFGRGTSNGGVVLAVPGGYREMQATSTVVGSSTDSERSFVPSPDDELLDDVAPMARDRCNTWPMQRPNMDNPTQTSPLMHEQIPEEDPDWEADGLYDSSDNIGRLGASSATSSIIHSPESNVTNQFASTNTLSSPVPNGAAVQGTSIEDSPTGCCVADATATGSTALPGSKKSTTRRNAWGSMSYADLITQAIDQSPEKRLTLSQVYEWMVQNVSYFRDKGDSNSSAGWKNSIRHNLSLHSRFMRIQNEGAGKSSWWVINPDAKPGRNPRRTRACTLDSTSKAVLEKKRRGARKKAMDSRAGGTGMGSTMSSLAGSQASIMSPLNMYADEEGLHGSFDPSMFRARAASNLSVPGSSSRVSPTEQFEDFEFPSWVEVEARPPIPSDILDRTDQMRIDACRGGSMSNGVVKQEPGTKIIKSEAGAPPPPSYQELNSVRGPSQLQNPLLRNHQITSKYDSGVIPSYPIYNWASPMHLSQQGSCAAAQGAAVGSLPIDLENLTLPDQPLMEMDVESLLRHELSQTRDHRINFEGI